MASCGLFGSANSEFSKVGEVGKVRERRGEEGAPSVAGNKLVIQN